MNEDNRFDEITYSRYKIRYGDYAIVEIDKGFTEILGYTNEDIAGGKMRVTDLILEEDWDDYCKIVTESIEKTGAAYLGHRLKKKNGDIIFVFCFGEILPPSEDGNVYGDILITDITKTRELSNEMENLAGINSELNNELISRSKLLESVLNNLAGGIAVFDIEKNDITLTYISDSFYKVFNYTKGVVGNKGDDFINLAVESDRKAIRKQIRTTLTSNKMTVGEYRFPNLNDLSETYWIQVCLSPVSFKKGVFTISALFINITPFKEAEIEMNTQAELLKLVVEGSDEMLFSHDMDTDKFEVTKYKDGKLVTVFKVDSFVDNVKASEVFYPEDRNTIAGILKKLSIKNEKVSADFRLDIEKTGRFEWYRALAVGITDDKGTIKKVIGKIFSIHEEKMRSQELILRAERDSLTGIYNHSTFVSKVNRMFPEFQGSLCALFMIDLDDFKLVNDALGHYAGDDLLCETAVVLETLSGMYGGFSGRLGGDEFVMFIPDVEDKETALKIASEITQGVREIECKTVHSASVGIALSKISGETSFDELYSQSDQALYSSKRFGKDRYMIFGENLEITQAGNDISVSSYSDEEYYQMDDLSDVVYISDIQTNELYYMNKAAKICIGLDENDSSYVGKKCYEMLQGLDIPCPFCTNKLISNDKAIISHHKNLHNGKEYVLKDRIISWNGKKCRMEQAVDISDSDKVTQVIADRYDIEDALVTSITQISKGLNHAFDYSKLLETVGEYYGAKHACMIEYGKNGDGKFHEWKAANENALDDKLEFFYDEKIIKELEEISGDKDAIILSNIMDYQDKKSLIYNFCIDNRIWSMYSVAIKDNEKNDIGRLFILNPQIHCGDLKLIKLISVYIGNDVVRQRLAKERHYELTHDITTKAYNRSSYASYANSSKELNSVGIVVIDINEMRNIFDEFGQTYVDDLLVRFAGILRGYFPAGKLFRIGDDDFVVVCENISKAVFLDKIELLKKKLNVGEFSACMGYAWDDYDMNIRRMERHAGDMLYLEKQKWYDMKDEHSFKWMTLSRDLVKEDIANNMFSVYLQPKVDYRNDEIYGAEALVRYAKPDDLANVISRLEKSRNIKYMDLFVLESVCKTLKDWNEKGLEMIPISCNLSRITFLEDDMPETINRIVESYDIPKNMIEIEVTESIGEMEHEMVARIANKLHAAGFRLAMDDFGTQYSNVSILSSMKFDVIKLDRSLVYNIDTDEAGRKILKHLVWMCTDLGVECIAEGVETKQQAEYLKEMGCNNIQGFLYSKPVDTASFERMYIKKKTN